MPLPATTAPQVPPEAPVKSVAAPAPPQQEITFKPAPRSPTKSPVKPKPAPVEPVEVVPAELPAEAKVTVAQVLDEDSSSGFSQEDADQPEPN